MNRRIKRIIAAAMIMTLMIPSAWNVSVLAEVNDTDRNGNDAQIISAEEAGPAENEDIQGPGDDAESGDVSDIEAPELGCPSDEVSTEESGDEDCGSSDAAPADPEEPSDEYDEVSQTQQEQEQDESTGSAGPAEILPEENSSAEEQTEEKETVQEEDAASGQEQDESAVPDEPEEILTEEDRPEEQQSDDTEDPDADDVTFNASQGDYLAYDPLYIAKYADPSLVDVTEMDLTCFYDIVTAAKGIATYNLRTQADFDVKENNYIAGLTYEMPVYDVDPDSRYYVAIPDVNLFNNDFRAYDLTAAYNNDYAETIRGIRYRKGILYIPKRAVDDPENRHEIPAGSVIAVQLNYAIGRDMDFSKSIPVQILTHEDGPVEKTVRTGNIFDSDLLSVDTGVKGRKESDVSVFLNGSIIPVTDKAWTYDRSTGTVDIAMAPGVVSSVNVVFRQRDLKETAADITTGLIEKVIPHSYADTMVSQDEMKFFRDEDGNKIELDISSGDIFVGWRGYYNGSYTHGAGRDDLERMESKKGWHNSVSYMYGGYTEHNGLGGHNGAEIDRNLAPLWAFSSYALDYDVGLRTNYNTIGRNEQITHWDSHSGTSKTMTIYEWLMHYKDDLEKSELKYGGGGTASVNGLGGTNNFAFTLPKKIHGAETSLVPGGTANGDIRIDSEDLERLQGPNDTSIRYDYWIAASCNHLDQSENEDGESAEDASIYVTCLGVGQNYVILAFVQSKTVGYTQNACAIYKFAARTGVNVRVKKDIRDSNDISGNDNYSVKGSTFKLYRTEEDARNDTGAAATFTISSDGVSGTSNTVENIPTGRYYIVETRAGKGLVIPDAYSRSNGGKRITLSDEGTKTVPLVGGTLEIPVTNTYAGLKVRIRKDIENADDLEDDGTYSVKGSAFSLYRTEADAKSGRDPAAEFKITTDGLSGKSGTAENIPAGKYYLVETQAGKGLIIPDKYKAENAGVSVTLKDGGTETVPAVNGTLEISVTNKYASINVRVRKGIVNSEKVEGNTAYSVKGSTFRLYKSSANARTDTDPVATFTIDKDGVSGISDTQENLPAGDYYITETKAGKGLLIPDGLLAGSGGKKVTLRTSGTETVPVVNGVAEIMLNNQPVTASARLKKQAAKTYFDLVRDHPDYYSLAGAEYRLYTDSACTKPARDVSGRDAVLTTAADGSTNVLEMYLGTYYVKETKASKGFEIDSGPNKGDPVVLGEKHTAADPYVITSVEMPKPAYVRLKKSSVKTFYDVVAECPDHYSLAGAQYKLYTDSGCTKAAKDFDGNEAVLTTGNDGYTNILRMVPGTYYAKETRASKGFEIDTKPNGGKGMTVTPDNTESQPAVFTSAEQPKPSHVRIIKKAARTDTDFLREAPNNYSLEGAVYRIYRNRECTDPARDFSGRAAVLTTGKNGETPVLEMLPGTYYIKEITASRGFLFDMETRTVTATLENNKTNPAVFDSVEEPAYGKFDVTMIKQTGEGNFGYRRLLGAEYTLSYYDIDLGYGDVTPDASVIAGKTPQRKWVFRTRAGKADNGLNVAMIDFGTDTPVSGGSMYKAGGDSIMPDGVFTLQETKAPVGIGADPTVYYGKVQQPLNGAYAKTAIQGSDRLKVEHGAEGFDMLNDEPEKSVLLKVQKVDAETGEPVPQGKDREHAAGSLSGAVYEVYMENTDYDHDIKVGEIITDENGYGELDRDSAGNALKAGRYYIQETAASPGYVTDQMTTEEERGKYEEGRHILVARYDGSSDKLVYEYSVTSKDNSHHTVISKTDIATGAELPGAEMQVLDSQGNVVEEWVSSEEPHDIAALHDETQGLRDGKYILREITAPYGYDTAEDVEFEVRSDSIENTVEMKNAPVVIHTAATDMETRTHAGRFSGDEKIRDIVRFENLYAGRTYTFEGFLVDRETGEALTDADGDPVESGPVEYTPAGEKGTLVSGEVEIEFTVDASLFEKEKTLVAFEKVSREKRELQIHADLSDKEQTVWFGLIASTVAVDKTSGNHNVLAAPDRTVTDTVRYKNLAPGETYRLDGEFFDKTTGKLTGIRSSQEFTPDEPDGTVDAEFTFDASGLEGHTLTAFETLSVIPHDEDGKGTEPVEIYKHEDPEDEDQTIHIPVIRTTAEGEETGAHMIMAKQDAVIRDIVKYENLIPGREYTARGKMVYKDNGNDVVADGKTVTAEAKFTPEGYDGEVVLEFRFNAVPVAGRKIVAFEEVYEEYLVGVHADIEDKEQTVYVPEIGTTAIDSVTGEHVAAKEDVLTVIDTVKYQTLLTDCDYVMRGKLVSGETGEDIMYKGEPVTAEKKFTPEGEDGEVELEFTLGRDAYEGDATVAFEECYIIRTREGDDGESVTEEEILIAEHKDIEDEGQTVHIPEIRTNAADSETKDHISCGDGKVTIIDTVTYRHLAPGKEYTVTGTLIDKSSGKAVMVNGEVVTASRRFTPKEADGSEDIRFTFDGSLLRGKTVVAFENVYCEDILVAVHADLNDMDQSVVIPEIRTTAADSKTHDHIAAEEDKITLTDTVRYKNLLPDREYVMKGTLMSVKTGKPLRNKGRKVTAKASFIPDSADGETVLEFTFRRDSCEGDSVVAFEECYIDGVLICDHRDIDDEDQTVRIPEIRTTAVDSETGDHVSEGKRDTVIIDTVEYRNLMPETEYRITGVLIDRSNGDVVNSNGENVSATATFNAESADGAAELSFELDGTELRGREVVAYEYLYYGDILIAVHADFDDKNQTVMIGGPDRPGPKTGDDNNISAYLVIAALALSVMMMVRRRRQG